MRRIWIVAVAALISILPELSHAGEWAMTYGGEGDDYASSIQQTADGGYVVAGKTHSFGGNSIWVLKLNFDGTIDWQKAYGQSTNGGSIIETMDGGYLVVGWTDQFTDSDDLLILKLDANGSVEWQKAMDGARPGCGHISVLQTTNGDYLIGGYIPGDSATASIGLLKLNSDGDISAMKWYGSGEMDCLHDMGLTADGGCILAGTTFDRASLNTDWWVLKLNIDGTIDWQKKYGGPHPYHDWVCSVQQTFNQQGDSDGYIVAGYTSLQGSEDIWILKLNPDGTVAWQKTYGGSWSEQAQSIKQTTDGGYVVAGAVGSFGFGAYDLWVLKLNPDGTVAWQKTYGGSAHDYASSIQQTADGGYVVAGNTHSFGGGLSDILVLKLDLNGDISISECSAIMGTTNVIGSDTFLVGEDTTVLPQDSFLEFYSVNVVAEDTPVTASEVCLVMASYTAYPRQGVSPLRVQFSDQSTGTVSSWSWDFGDQVTSTEQNPSHSYTSAGDFTVSLTVAGPDWSETETKRGYIHVSEPITAPIIDKLKRNRREPGQKFNIVGNNFGEGNTGDYVHIGGKELPYDHNGIIEWTPTDIKVKLPKKKYVKKGCAWFQGLDERKVKVWVNVGGTDSNKKRLILLKPADCQ